MSETKPQYTPGSWGALIEAAPTMLSALKLTAENLRHLKHNVLRSYDTVDEWLNVVDAAIAQAEGAARDKPTKETAARCADTGPCAKEARRARKEADRG